MVQKRLLWPRGSLSTPPRTSPGEARPVRRLPVQLTRERNSLCKQLALHFHTRVEFVMKYF